MLWLFSGPPGFTCWISFTLVLSFYVLSRPYLCFISFLYLDLSVLGDNVWLGKGSFMQTKILFVLIHIWCHETGVSPAVKYFTDRLKNGTPFVDHLSYFCLVLVILSHLFIAALWSHAGKGLTSWLSFMMFKCVSVIFQCGILGLVKNLIVSIPDLCPLPSLLWYFIRIVCWQTIRMK